MFLSLDALLFQYMKQEVFKSKYPDLPNGTGLDRFGFGDGTGAGVSLDPFNPKDGLIYPGDNPYGYGKDPSIDYYGYGEVSDYESSSANGSGYGSGLGKGCGYEDGSGGDKY